MSILDNTSAMNHSHHVCGGTILSSTGNGEEYQYCDRCGAFAYSDTAADVPSGADKTANKAAWDDGDTESPSAPLDDVYSGEG